MIDSKQNIFDPSYAWDFKLPTNRHSQEFRLFINEKIDQIIHLRAAKKININKLLKSLNELRKAATKCQVVFEKLTKKKNIFEVNKDATYQKLRTIRDRLLSEIKNETNSKLSMDEVEHILSMNNRPISWRKPLSCFILTGKIIVPSERCLVYPKNDRIIVEVSPDANVDDFREAFKTVKAYQAFIKASEQKNRKVKPKFERNQRILALSKKHKKMTTITDKVFGDNGSLEDLKLDKKRADVIRKTIQRSKG